MKSRIKISLLASILFISGGLFMANPINSYAQASGCPNGCMGAGDGCFCHTWHLDYKEYTAID